MPPETEEPLAPPSLDDEAFNAQASEYRAEGNWDALAALYLDRRDYTDDEAEKRALLEAVADVYASDKADPAAAFVVALALFAEAPLEPATRHRLTALAGATGDWSSVANAYTEAISAASPGASRDAVAELHAELATIYLDAMHRAEMAEVHGLRVLELVPTHDAAMQLLERVYTGTGDVRGQADVLSRRLASFGDDEGERARMLLQLARLREALGDDDAAAACLREALQWVPTLAEAREALEALYRRRGDWGALLGHLEAQLTTASDLAQRGDLARRIARLLLDQMQQPERATEAFERAFAEDPEEPEVLDELLGLYRVQHRWDDYLRALATKLRRAADDRERHALWLETARVQRDHLGKLDLAIHSLREALEARPGEETAEGALEDLLSATQAWADLADLVAAQRVRAGRGTEGRALLLREHDLATTRLGDDERARTCLDALLAWDAGDEEALVLLSQLHGRRNEWDACAAALTRLLPHARRRSTGEEVALLLRIGRLYLDEVDDPTRAREVLEQVLDRDAGNRDALHLLRDLHNEHQDWHAVVATLDREVAQTSDLRERAALLARSAGVFARHLERRELAAARYQQAFDLDPDNVDAARFLGQAYYDEEQWARAIPPLEVVVRHDRAHVGPDGVEALAALHAALAHAREELGDDNGAERDFSDAYRLQRTNRLALEGLDRIYRRRGDLERAARITGEMLALDEHGGADTALLMRQVGTLRAAGDPARALELCARVLALEPQRPDALREMATLGRQVGDWVRAVDALAGLAIISRDPDEALQASVDAGDILLSELGDPEGAVEAYVAALERAPESVLVLERLLRVFRQTENWLRLTEVLGKLASLETDGLRYAKRCIAIGLIFREHLDDPERAADILNKALDRHLRPDTLVAFDTIEGMRRELGQWRELERDYRRMLERLHRGGAALGEGTAGALSQRIWRELGKLYTGPVPDAEKAIATYEMIAGFDPEDREPRVVLAKLRLAAGRTADERSVHHDILAVDPRRAKSYHALYQSYRQSAERDPAWCMAAALVAMGQAKPDEADFYGHFAGGPLTPLPKLSKNHLRLLMHPDLDAGVCVVFSFFAAHLREAISYDLKDAWRLHPKKDAVDIEQRTVTLAIFRECFKTFGLRPVRLFANAAHPRGVRNLNLEPPGLLVGTELLESRDVRRVAFVAAKAVSLLRPAFYVGGAYPVAANLERLLAVAIHVAHPSSPPPRTPEEQALAQAMSSDPALRAKLTEVVTGALRGRGGPPDLQAWLRAADLSSDRAGLLMCGDVGEAIRAIGAEAGSLGGTPASDRLEALLAFSVSREYLDLRFALGAQVRPGR